ncbi:hypothetical protein AVEN_195728-1 [Araneus ventricosus]|uniref:Uncharacterized protein n=1 Tax=Araneus ventricosus TaxID=182803 RepID=A0A4Y2UE05_ARAVE|nr:hypothetical protein AVEN_195728-1 [Araneus ventricosus]
MSSEAIQSKNGVESVTSQIAILVCSNLALQACNKFDMTASLKQVCTKLTQAPKSPCVKFAMSNSLQTIAKTEYEHNLELELATSRFLS